MEVRQIKELMSAMGRTGIRRLSIKKEGFELELEREENGSYKPYDQSLDSIEENPLKRDMERANLTLARAPQTDLPGRKVHHTDANEKEEVPGNFITSPMVGTFYSAPSPDDAPFIKVGDKVEKGTVVCIIEAMKVMNEVKSGASGTIMEVLVESGHPVEFGTKLFKIS